MFRYTVAVNNRMAEERSEWEGWASPLVFY